MTSAGPATARPAAAASMHAPLRVRRVLSLVAVIALIAEAQQLWRTAAAPPLTLQGHLIDARAEHAALVLTAMAAFGLLAVAAVVVLGARSARTIGAVDAGLLVVGLVTVLGEAVLDHRLNDEGLLTARAAGSLLRGGAVYGVHWPDLFGVVPVTKTMDGGTVTSYDYPPLAVLLTAAVGAVLHHADIAAAVVTTAALFAAALLLWWRLAPVWRPLVIVVVLAFDQLPGSARAGAPVVLAVALLLPPLLGLDRMGAGGRLRLSGVLQAAALGAACATQQLAWFVVPFLALTLVALRIPEDGARRAIAAVARYLAVAAAVWVLIDLPFLLTQPGAWLRGILLPLRQHAIVHGQGLVDVPYLATGGSGALDLFSVAPVVLLAGLLIALVLLPDRLGPAVAVLPVVVFYVSTRFDAAYWMQLSPLWLAVAGSVPLAAFQRARRPALTRRLGTPASAALGAALVVPAVVIALAGALSPAPLRLHLTAVTAQAHHPSRLGRIDLTAENTSGRAVTPHFAYLMQGGASTYWRVLAGPATLRPGQRADYVLEARGVAQPFAQGTAFIAVSDRPMTLSSTPMPDSIRTR